MTPRERRAIKKLLIGRTIVGIEWQEFDSGNAGTREGSLDTQDPTLILDDGSRVSFMVEETEIGEYGVAIRASRNK